MSEQQNQEVPEQSAGQAAATDVESGQQQESQQADDQYYSYGIFKQRMRFDPLLIVFIILLEIGGIIGYVTKESVASIVSSTIFAILLAGATYLDGARRNTYPLLVLLLVLFGMMLYRAVVAGAFMPAGLVALLTLIMLLRHSYFVYARRQVVRA